MSISFEQLKQEAAKLPEAQRVELALAMLRSLDDDGDDPDEIERAWLDEISRRSAEIDRGEAQMIPGEEAIARLRARLS
ncbi:MAG: addiction module protein [Chloroflexota bacterium]